MNGLGYRANVLRSPKPDDGPENEWVAVARRGEVTAVRCTVAWSWTNESGATMQANAGDWQITNDTGRSWSVASDIFPSTYSHIAGDRWRRTGSAQARPAVPGEVINSLEGRQTAAAGDWVIRGPKGEEWVITAKHFAGSYQISEPSSLRKT